jgi:hypothetical protein
MAKPIKSTPELSGEEANEFLSKMIKVEETRITPKQIEFSKEIEQNMKLLTIC